MIIYVHSYKFYFHIYLIYLSCLSHGLKAF